jgi:hypothetical protein
MTYPELTIGIGRVGSHRKDSKELEGMAAEVGGHPDWERCLIY